MRILVSGSSGFVGSRLVSYLTDQGETVVRLRRRSEASGQATPFWDPKDGIVKGDLEGFDAVIHLAGEPLAQRWTDEAMERIRSSRADGTLLLSKTLAGLPRPPAVFLSSSAIGYYGDRGEELLTESSHPGTGFLAGVCRDWEDVTEPAVRAGIRTVQMRIGIVLGRGGGALSMMLPIFRLGLGGPLGNGSQFMSWISLHDLVRAIAFLIADDNLSGPVNMVAPNPVRNADFTKVLASVLNRPALIPVPEFGPRLVFGKLADEALFAGQRVSPEKLSEAGFKYEHSDLRRALEKAV